MSIETRYQQKLVQRIGEDIQTVSLTILEGRLNSFEDYKSHTSRLRALRDVLAMCDETASAIAKD